MSPATLRQAVLMCHAPIVIPAVGGTRREQCQATTAGMQAAAAHLTSQPIDALIVISPHTPRSPTSFTQVMGPRLRGDMSNFGAPQVCFDLPAHSSATAAIDQACADEGLALPKPIPPFPLDHGAAVPLQFLADAGWEGPTLVFGLPYHSSHRANQAFGRALARAAQTLDERWGLLASGDMSHRLTPGAPAGYNPQAQRFDDWVVAHVKKGDFEGALTVDGALRRRAAEDVIDSLGVARGATGSAEGHRFLSYEGPFGVGYLVAILTDKPAAQEEA